MAIQNDNTILCKGDLKAYHEKILPYLGGNFMLGTNVSDYYETTEKIVGVWTNGKPLYQLTVIDTMPKVTTAGTYVTKNVTPSISNVDLIFVKNSFVIDPNSITRPMPYTLNSGYQSKVSAAKTYLQVASAITEHSQRPFYAIIQYTKTTDAENSAAATPGCYDINFPNTWPVSSEIYFGNGVYGYKIPTPSGDITTEANGSWISQTSFSTNLTSILNCGGSFINKTGNYSVPIGTHNAGFGKLIDIQPFIDENNDLKVYLENYGSTATTWSVKNFWVTYTK